MASYPDGVYSPRAKENKPGVVYDSAKKTVAFVEDVTKLDDEVVAIETELGANPKGVATDVAERLDNLEASCSLFSKFWHAITWESLDGFVSALSAGSSVAAQCCAIKFTTGGTNGNYSFIRQNDAGGYYNPFNAGKPITVEWVLKTGVTVTTRTVLLHFAYTNSSPPNPAFPHMGFKIVNGDIFASSAGIAGEKLDDTGVNENPAAIEEVRLRVVCDPGVSLKFYVNDVLKITRLTDLPANANSNYLFNEGVTTNTGAARYLYLGRHLVQIPY